MTAKERFEHLAHLQTIGTPVGLGHPDMQFLIALVEAAVERLKEFDEIIALEFASLPGSDDEIWKELEERMAGRGKK